MIALDSETLPLSHTGLFGRACIQPGVSIGRKLASPQDEDDHPGCTGLLIDVGASFRLRLGAAFSRDVRALILSAMVCSSPDRSWPVVVGLPRCHCILDRPPSPLTLDATHDHRRGMPQPRSPQRSVTPSVGSPRDAGT